MQRINQIIKAVSNVFGCTPKELTTMRNGNDRRLMRTRALFYFCVEAIGKGESKAGLRDIRVLTNSELDLILQSHLHIKYMIENKTNGSYMMRAVQYQINTIVENDLKSETNAKN